MKVSNAIVGIINLLSGALSVAVIGGGIWLTTRHRTDCVHFLEWPIIAIGIFILVASLAGLIGSCRRIMWLLWLYLAFMFLLILLLLCFTVFAFMVTNKGAGQVVSGKGYKEYRTSDYSTWLQRHVNNPKDWARIRSCLVDAKFCSHLNEQYPTEVAFNQAALTPTQSGCCTPPTQCGFTYVNATTWRSLSPLANEADCQAWGNDLGVLCYGCNSCKGGVLQNLSQDWRKIAIINVVVLACVTLIYSIGCCAFCADVQQNNKSYS